MTTPRGFRYCLLGPLLIANALAAINTIELLATDPSAPAALDKSQQLNFRIAYTTDRRVKVRVEPSYQGKSLPATNSGMVSHDAGAGEAYFWVSYNGPVKMDHADLILLDDETGKALANTNVALDVAWSGVSTGAAREDAEWVKRMAAENAALARKSGAERDARRKASGGSLSEALSDLAMTAAGLSVPGYFLLQALFLFRWHGGWRKAALIPLAPMAVVVVYVLFATLVGGSNIAPVAIFLLAPFGFLYLAAVWLVRLMSLKPSASQA